MAEEEGSSGSLKSNCHEAYAAPPARPALLALPSRWPWYDTPLGNLAKHKPNAFELASERPLPRAAC